MHISSKRDKLFRTCSGNGVLYVSIKSLGKAWAHRPCLYLDRSSFSLSRTSADTRTGGQGTESEVGEKVTFKRGNISGRGLREEANEGAFVDAAQVQAGAKCRVFWLRVVVGKLLLSLHPPLTAR